MENTGTKYGPYSPSRLDTALCGYAFYKQYIDPNRTRVKSESLAAARGSVVHEVFEKMNEQIKAGNLAFNPEHLRQWVSDSIHRYPAAYEDMQTIMDCVRLYANNPPAKMPSDAEIEVKLALGTDLTEYPYDSKEALIRGRADVLWFDDDLRAHILDYKTQPNVETADTFQMGVYAFVISKIYSIKEVYTQIYFARYGKYSAAYLWTAEELQKVEDVLLAKIHNIETRESWEPLAHNGCQYCPYQLECPLFKDNFAIDEKGLVTVTDQSIFNVYTDVYRAQKLASVLIQLEEVISQGKTSVREFIKQTGQPIASGNKAFMYKVDDGIDYNYVNKNLKHQLFNTMAKHGVDGRNYCNFNKTSLEPAFFLESEKSQFVKELADLLPKKVSSTFGCYKV